MGSAPASHASCPEDAVAQQLRAFSAAPGDLLRQVSIFRKCGFVIIRDLVGGHQCDGLLEFCKTHMQEFCTENNFRRVGHWSCNSWLWWQCDALLDVMSSAVIHELMTSILGDKWARWHFVKLAGDFVTSACDYNQLVHSDGCGKLDLEYWWSHREQQYKVWGDTWPASIAVSVACHDILPDNAPMAIARSWDHHKSFSVVHGSDISRMHIDDDDMLRVTLPRGWLVVRDIRLAHCGTANRLSHTRFLPGFLCSSQCQMTYDMYRPKQTLDAAQWQSFGVCRQSLSKRTRYMCAY